MHENQPIKDCKDILKRLEERQRPIKNISAYYEEARKQEEEARKKAEGEELAKLPPKTLTTDEQIQQLTKAVVQLTLKLEEKGNK